MGFNPVSVIIVECNKDNSYPGETLLQNPGHFYPTHSGQTDIGDHEIGRFFLHFHQRFLRRIRLSDDPDKSNWESNPRRNSRKATLSSRIIVLSIFLAMEPLSQNREICKSPPGGDFSKKYIGEWRKKKFKVPKVR